MAFWYGLTYDLSHPTPTQIESWNEEILGSIMDFFPHLLSPVEANSSITVEGQAQNSSIKFEYDENVIFPAPNNLFGLFTNCYSSLIV